MPSSWLALTGNTAISAVHFPSFQCHYYLVFIFFSMQRRRIYASYLILNQNSSAQSVVQTQKKTTVLTLNFQDCVTAMKSSVKMVRTHSAVAVPKPRISGCHSTDVLYVILGENNAKVTVDFNRNLFKVEGAMQGKLQRCLSENLS